MMKVTTEATLDAGIKTLVSLNPIMIDGTGMCGGCRVSVGGETKFACVDGPEFDAAKIDWDEMLTRLGSYKSFEAYAREQHACKMGIAHDEQIQNHRPPIFARGHAGTACAAAHNKFRRSSLRLLA